MNQRFLIVLQDYTSKWPEVGLCGNTTTGVIIKFLNNVFGCQGYPVALVTDNGPQFTSVEFADFLKIGGIKHNRTAVYHPMANGMVERFNRVLKEGLQVGHLEGKDWERTLRDVLIAYRSTAHAATGCSPFELLHNGRKMRTKLCIPGINDRTSEGQPSRGRIATYQRRYQERADARNSARPVSLKIGDYVRHRLQQVPKGKSTWSIPLRVIQRKGPSTFQLEDEKVWNARDLCKTEEPISTEQQNADLQADMMDIRQGGQDQQQAVQDHAAEGDAVEPAPPAPQQLPRPARHKRQTAFYQAGFA
jgi:hypothetical protein